MQIFNIFDLLLNSAQKYPMKEAVIDSDRRYTYEQLYELSLRISNFLLEKGLKKGERVAVLMKKNIEMISSIFAIAHSGGIFVIINPILKPHQIHHIITDCEPSFVLTDEQTTVPALHTNVNIIKISPDGRGLGSSYPLKICHSVIGSDLATIIYTSGSTGFPKGIMLSHENLVMGARIVSDYLDISDEDRLLSLLSFSFDYGLNQLFTTVIKGATLILQDVFISAVVCEILHKENITGLAMVPYIWSQLLGRFSPFTSMTFPQLRYITNSGGTISVEQVRLMQENLPNTQIFLMYGLTEAFRSTYLSPDRLKDIPSSIGKAIPNVEILVIKEDGNCAQPGEEGELVHRGGVIAQGYWKDPKLTNAVFRCLPKNLSINFYEKAVYSGDIVVKDQEGYLYYRKRKDNLIKHLGYRISPDEIESVVVRYHPVSVALVFGIPKISGESQLVLVYMTFNGSPLKEEDILNFIEENLPKYMLPDKFIFMKDIPLTANGKPDRSALKTIVSLEEEI